MYELSVRSQEQICGGSALTYIVYALLGIAGLNFVGNACYYDVKPDKDNIAQFEFIPWILSQCENVKEARKLLENIICRNYI